MPHDSQQGPRSTFDQWADAVANAQQRRNRLAPILSPGYAYASSRRYPREPETVITSGVGPDSSERYSWVGTWRDAADGQREYNAFRKQLGSCAGPRYLFQVAIGGGA